MDETNQLLGIVKSRKLHLLQPDPLAGAQARLTRIKMQQAQSPDSAEIDLTDYEGQAIMVRGREAGEWIYSAEVIDQVGPILSAVVEKLFSK
jgi:hypothetical protein